MLKPILETSRRNEELHKLLEKAQEYAEVYLLAKKRQKGRNGMGAVATLKDEFKSVLDEMMQYCSKKGYITNNILYDVDDMADEFLKIKLKKMPLLEVRALTFQAGDKKILDGLSLSIDSGEVHALLGTNGTGKSTLAYLIMGCEGYRPSSGEIIFDGKVINDLPIHERARLGITLAWQEPVRKGRKAFY